MKTKQLRKFLSNLSKLNNSFTHYTFVWKQFDIDYKPIIKSKPDELTQSEFSKNPYSKKHNIALKKLKLEHKKTHKTLIEGIFLLSFSYYESYLKSVLKFARKMDNSINKIGEKIEGEEDDYLIIDKVINRIRLDKTKISDLDLVTLDYLRLRRNSITHRNSKSISKSLKKLINTSGHELNQYWTESLRTGLHQIDFNSKKKLSKINFDFIIDTINILRTILEKIDTRIIETLGEELIVEKVIIPKFLRIQRKNLNHLSKERLVKKFISFSRLEYSTEINDIYERELLKMV